MAAPCIFCGKPSTTKEHCIPAWIAKRFELEDVRLEEVWSVGVSHRRQPISYKSYRKRFFCGDCQSHFKRVEDRTIPLLEALERREGCEFTDADRSTLAELGAKTAMSL